MTLKQLVELAEKMPGYDKEEVDDLPLVVVTAKGERLAVVGVGIEGGDRITLEAVGARELGLER